MLQFIKNVLMWKFKDFLKKLGNYIWRKKRTLLVSLSILWMVWIWGYNKYFKPAEDTSFFSNDYEVITWDVSNSLNLIWTTQFANAQKLTFVNKGRVTSVKTKVGATVKKWDILATITTDDLDRKVEDKKKEIKNLQLKLNTILSKSDKNLDILRAQSNYDLLILQKETQPSEQILDIQTKKSNIQDIERQIKDKEKDLREAKNDYAELLSWRAWATHAELTIWSRVRNRNTTIEKLIRDFRTSAVEIQTTLDEYDKVMKMTDLHNWENENVYIWAKNQRLVSESKQNFRKVNAYTEKLNTLYNNFSAKQIGQITENELLDAYAVFKNLWDDLVQRWRINYDMFQDSIESVGTLERSQIDWYTKTFGTSLESQWYSYYDKYNSAVESLANLKDSDTTIEDAADKVEKLSIELDTLKINLQKANNELTIAEKQHVLDAAELDKKITDAKVDLEKAKQWNAQQEEIDTYKNEIDNAQFALTTLMKEYDDYKIIANFDGVVTKLDMQIWDSIETNSNSSSDQKYIYVETPDLLEVNLDIDQIDIVKISTWMPVEVYLDAFPENTYTWVFSEIDTMPDSSSDMWWWNYKAKVVFQKNSPEERILWGMSANIKVVLNEEKDALVIPNPAIVDNEIWEKIVLFQDKNGEWIDKVIEIWLSDDVNTVVLSGLKAWDIIKGLYITDSAITNAWIVDDEDSFW